MASKKLLVYCAVIILTQFDCKAGGIVKLGIGFTTLSPPEVVALKNHPLLLNCSGYSDDGTVQVFWRFQDADINDRLDKHVKIFPNGSLYIDRLVFPKKREKRWDGNYTCLLRNKAGILVSRPIHVIVARMSKSFTYEPQPMSTHESNQARFSCQINAVPPATITWYKDGFELPQNDSRYIFLQTGVLQISDLTLSDAGNYKCRCSNMARQKNSSEATLTVFPRVELFEPPVMLSTTQDITTVSGEPAVLECIASGFPKVEYFWRREDGKEIAEQFWGSSGNLYFPQVKFHHSGSYICVAKVTSEETSQSAEATHTSFLRVQVPPTFTKVPVSQLIPTSQTVRFDCEVEGVPESSIYWMKDGEQLYIDGRIKLRAGKTLIVSHTVTSDSGIYHCVASNSAGVNIASARLHVNVSGEQPHPPAGLKAVTVSSSAILLSWDSVLSLPSSPIQAYTVHYMPASGGVEQNAVAVNTSLLIERLKPFTNYSFYVRAYNNKSASEPSKSIVQMTGEDVPLIAPKVTLSSISPSILHVQWNELPPDKTRGTIIEHRLYIRKHNQASYSVQTIKAGMEYTIRGLIPKQKYDVRVLGGTNAGFPILSEEAWPWVVHEMPEASTAKVPSSPVLHLTVLNSTALEVEWNMPNTNPHPFTGFYLSYKQQNLPLEDLIALPSSATKYQLYNLVPQSWYEVHLVAFNEHGESEEAVRNIITFSGDNPETEIVEVVEPPHDLEAEPTSFSSIHLTWKMPNTIRNISYYTVRYHSALPSGLVNESHISYLRSTNNEVLITDLQPFTLYEFSVQSHDVHMRQGPFSHAVECRTTEALPSPPDDLSWTPIDAKTIRLNWQPPKFPNGIITGYRIMYSSRIDENDLDRWNSKEEKGTETFSILSGLSSNTHYYVSMKARNGAGLSAPTPVISLNIPVRHNSSKLPSHETYETDQHDPFLGIILGISIGVGCIIICTVVLIYRKRCCRTQAEPSSEGSYSVCCDNGYIPHLNGNSGNVPAVEKRASQIESQEMDCFTPMLNNYSNGSNDHHLDTKGGYPPGVCNGKVNGIPQQFLVNSQLPLASQQGSTASSHISDAKDHPVSKQRMRYNANDCKVEDDTWQKENTDINSSTVLLDSTDPLLSTTALQADDDPSQLENDKPSLHGTKINNPEAESSSITEPQCSESSPQTLKNCTVPSLISSTSHQSSSVCANNQNSLVTSSSGQREILHLKDSGDTSPNRGEDNETQSLPFSVNSFPSPLSGPRFPPQSSNNMDSILEPT